MIEKRRSLHNHSSTARDFILALCISGGLSSFVAGPAKCGQPDPLQRQDTAKLSDVEVGLAYLTAKELLSSEGMNKTVNNFPAVVDLIMPGGSYYRQEFRDLGELKHHRDSVQRSLDQAKAEMLRRGAAGVDGIYDGIISPACGHNQLKSGYARIEQRDAEFQIIHDTYTLPGVVVKDSILVVVLPKLELLIGKVSEGNITLIAKSGSCSMSFAASPDLWHAIRADDIARVRSFIASGADVNEADAWGTPLDIAVSRGAEIIAELLIEAGADIEGATTRGVGGQHPLHLAAARLNAVGTARLLIKYGARIDAHDVDGKTPLIVAIMANNFEVADVLVAAGADLEAVDGTFHRSPLLWAAGSGNLDAAKFLLAKGAHINQKAGADGDTALHFAAIYKHLEMIDYLVKNGADLNAPNDKGLTPLKRTLKKRAQELLRRLGAKE